ncbi:hypothetical protein GCM10027594_12720 [Hymenobacter agri]
MPIYNAYLNALDGIIRENGGSIPELSKPFTASIVGHDPSKHTGLTVGDVLKEAFNELSKMRPTHDDVRALGAFYNSNADAGITKSVKDYVEKLKSIATNAQ